MTAGACRLKSKEPAEVRWTEFVKVRESLLPQAQGLLNYKRGVYMSKERERKRQLIEELAERLSRCSIAIAVDYRGVTAREMMQLRRQLADSGIEYRVVKNTLARFAGDKAGMPQLGSLLAGPVALAFSFDDAVKPARILREYVQSAGSTLQIKGGILRGRLLSAGEVASLAMLPPQEVLLARLVGQLQAPLQALHNVLAAPLRGLIGVLNARMRQLEAG